MDPLLEIATLVIDMIFVVIRMFLSAFLHPPGATSPYSHRSTTSLDSIGSLTQERQTPGSSSNTTPSAAPALPLPSPKAPSSPAVPEPVPSIPSSPLLPSSPRSPRLAAQHVELPPSTTAPSPALSPPPSPEPPSHVKHRPDPGLHSPKPQSHTIPQPAASAMPAPVLSPPPSPEHSNQAVPSGLKAPVSMLLRLSKRQLLPSPPEHPSAAAAAPPLIEPLPVFRDPQESRTRCKRQPPPEHLSAAATAPPLMQRLQVFRDPPESHAQPQSIGILCMLHGELPPGAKRRMGERRDARCLTRKQHVKDPQSTKRGGQIRLA